MGPLCAPSSPFAHRERDKLFPSISSPAPTCCSTLSIPQTPLLPHPLSSIAPPDIGPGSHGGANSFWFHAAVSALARPTLCFTWMGWTQEQHSADYRTCVFSMERWPQGILRTVGCGASSQSRGPSLHRWSNYPFPQKKCTCCRVQCSRPSQCASVGPCVVRNCSLSSVFNASRVRTVFHSGCLSTRLSGKVLWGGCRRMWEQPLRKWWHLPRHGQWLHLHLSAR